MPTAAVNGIEMHIALDYLAAYGLMTLLDGPLRRAVVRAVGPELRDGKSVSTDADGRWELREIPAGRLTIQVTKGGYVPLSFGQRRPFEAGKPIEVKTSTSGRVVSLNLKRMTVRPVTGAAFEAGIESRRS